MCVYVYVCGDKIICRRLRDMTLHGVCGWATFQECTKQAAFTDLCVDCTELMRFAESFVAFIDGGSG